MAESGNDSASAKPEGQESSAKSESKGEGKAFGEAGFGSATFNVRPSPVFGSKAKEPGEAKDKGEETASESQGQETGAASPEEECTAEFKPVVELEEVATTTGEEDEESLFESKAKLYRYVSDKGEWKERGTGTARLLKGTDSKIRCLMRRNQTLKICANFYVVPGINLTRKPESDRTFTWTCADFAEEEQAIEMFAMKFPSSDDAERFRRSFEESTEHMRSLLEQEGYGGGEGEGEGAKGKLRNESKNSANELADSLGQTSVSGKE